MVFAPLPTWEKAGVRLYLGDCLDILPHVGKVDAFATDPPYGRTRNKWDEDIDVVAFWDAVSGACSSDTSVIVCSQNPFAARLIESSRVRYRHDLVWVKNRPSGFLNAKRMPLSAHEMVLVFCDGVLTYNPQKTTGHRPVNRFTKHTADGSNYGATRSGLSGGGQTDRYPTSVLRFKCVSNFGGSRIHSTQKPVELMDWIVSTYTDAGEVVCDPYAGSGTTVESCIRLGRNCIAIERDLDIFQSMVKRAEKCLKGIRPECRRS